MEPQSSLPYSQAPATHLAYEYFITFVFHGEELLAPRPTPKLEDHPLSAVRDCLFNLFAATLHIGGRSSTRNLRTRHAVVTGTHKQGPSSNLYPLNIFGLVQGWGVPKFRIIPGEIISHVVTWVYKHHISDYFSGVLAPHYRFASRAAARLTRP